MRISLVEDEDDVGETSSRPKRKHITPASGSDGGEDSGTCEREKKTRRNGGDESGLIPTREVEVIVEEERRNIEKGLAVWIDPDVLDCSICYEPLSPPLYQCQNGHVMCFSCCTKLQNKCHVCSLFLGNIRCLALEKVIESIRIPCSHAAFGCHQILSQSHSDAHREQCVYAPCSCPVSECSFQGSKSALSEHFKSQHFECVKRVRYSQLLTVSLEQVDPFIVLYSEDDHLLLLLNRHDVTKGNALSLACIRPSAVEWDISYELIVCRNRNSLRLTALADNIRQWNGAYPVDVFLLVPHNFCGRSGKIFVDICVRKVKHCA